VTAGADSTTGPKRVAIYARVSSEAQAERGTIASQLEAVRSHLSALGADVVASYLDEGYSGARLDRPGLDALRDAAEAGLFEEVWCLCPDRLARSFPYQVLITDELASFGVAVHFTDSPPVQDDPQARLLVQVQGVIAEFERAKITERARRGKLFRVRAGEAVFGRVPYGYRRVPRGPSGPAHLVVYEPEAQVVRRIFDEYVAGSSLRQIVKGLHAAGRKTATGLEMWSPTTLAGLLRNPTFMGKASWYRTEYVARPGGARKQRRARAKDEWVEVAVPAIVSEETFAVAQAARSNHSAFSPRRSTPGKWLLRRLVVCGACGAHARAQQMTSANGNVNYYYSCSRLDPVVAGGPGRVCKQRRVRADALDAFVYDNVCQVLLRPEVLLAGEAVVASREGPQDDILATQLERLARRLNQAEAERRRLADLYQAGLVGLEELRHRGAEITARKASLGAEQAELRARHAELAGRDQLRLRLENFAARAATGLGNLDFDGRQRLVRLVVEQVRVTGWQVEIRLRIPIGGDHPDGGGEARHKPKPPTPKPGFGSRRGNRRTLSSELALRSADHKDLEALCGPGGLPLPAPALKGFAMAGLARESAGTKKGCPQNDLPACHGEQLRAPRLGERLNKSLPSKWLIPVLSRPSRRR